MEKWGITMIKRVLSIFVLFPLLSGCLLQSTPQSLEVDMYDGVGNKMGTATFSEKAEGMNINLKVSGLSPGLHGIHIHDVGKCEGPDFKSAGEHYNPEDKDHGLMTTEGPHAGDLPNINADEKGKVEVDLTAEGVSFRGEKSVLKGDGVALVIHEGQDDGVTDPAGNSGARVICGEVVEKKEGEEDKEQEEDNEEE